MEEVEKLFNKVESILAAGPNLKWQHRWVMLKYRIKKIFSSPVHVICLNDSVEAVVVGSKSNAKRKCAQMKAAYIKKHYYYMKGKELKDKERVLYYHLHTVNVFFMY